MTGRIIDIALIAVLARKLDSHCRSEAGNRTNAINNFGEGKQGVKKCEIYRSKLIAALTLNR